MGKSPSAMTTSFLPGRFFYRYKSLIGGEQYEPDEENPMIGFRGCGRYTDPFFEECFAMELEVWQLIIWWRKNDENCVGKKHNSWYPAWWTNSLLLKMAIEIVDFPINSMVIFHGKMLVHQRVQYSLLKWNALTHSAFGLSWCCRF